MEPAWGSLPPSFSAPLPHARSLSIQINKYKINKQASLRIQVPKYKQNSSTSYNVRRQLILCGITMRASRYQRTVGIRLLQRVYSSTKVSKYLRHLLILYYHSPGLPFFLFVALIWGRNSFHLFYSLIKYLLHS